MADILRKSRLTSLLYAYLVLMALAICNMVVGLLVWNVMACLLNYFSSPA